MRRTGELFGQRPQSLGRKLLYSWPHDSIQCLQPLGCGKYFGTKSFSVYLAVFADNVGRKLRDDGFKASRAFSIREMAELVRIDYCRTAWFKELPRVAFSGRYRARQTNDTGKCGGRVA
jgi:hypothetical protein